MATKLRMWVDPIRYAWERCNRHPFPDQLNTFVFDLKGAEMRGKRRWR